jgi:hypothetical protein
MARDAAVGAHRPKPPVSVAPSSRLARFCDRLPRAWTLTPKRRRLLALGLAAPGFALVFSAPLHRNLALLALGGALFAAALIFRRLSEPLFARAGAGALWPPAYEAPQPARPKEVNDA